MQKILYILRHAKAEAGSPTQDDFDRALMERGVQAAQLMGAHMAKNQLRPQLVWCSSSQRTRQTVAALGPAFVPPLEVEYRDKLYNASAGEILSMLASLPEEVQSLMVVAHNPGMHQLAAKLAKRGEDAALDDLAIQYPTCALTVVRFDDVQWRDLAVSTGYLELFLIPKMLGGVED